MVVKVAWSFYVTIENGPSMNLADSINTEAYDKISVKIDSNDADKKVAIQPGEADKIDFLCIKSDYYGPNPPEAGKIITYKCDAGSPITLDQAHVLIGTSLVKLLQNLKTLSFTNKTENPANIEVLIGRRAV